MTKKKKKQTSLSKRPTNTTTPTKSNSMKRVPRAMAFVEHSDNIIGGIDAFTLQTKRVGQTNNRLHSAHSVVLNVPSRRHDVDETGRRTRIDNDLNGTNGELLDRSSCLQRTSDIVANQRTFVTYTTTRDSINHRNDSTGSE